MSGTWQVRLSGAGGQGLILAGIILAEAAVIDGRNVVQSQVYGPESRGGASKAEVIISDQPIRYPKVTVPDVLLVMSQEAADRYAATVRPGGLLVVDTTHVHEVPEVDARVFELPISGVARDELGREIVASVVAVGVLVALTGVVSREGAREAVRARVPAGTEELNLRALEAGHRLAEKGLSAETRGREDT
ncbi:MAG TPA: 2-oxoacid:ferredoxin oxidoreductase subunit gamma [Clostridiales bacterium]|nr:2-oxoacid:ferredoxin oxidoreductase subunit gamma [Clostridiales bacterium]